MDSLYLRLIDRSDAAQLNEVRRMLDAGVPVNVRFDAGGSDTPLTHAAGFGHPAVVRLLLERGANPDARNDRGETALWQAAEAPLSESGIMTTLGPQPVTMAQTKAWRDAYVGITQALLARKANPNVPNLDGVTPLGVAAYRGREAQVSALLAGGANPNLVDRFGKTPVEWAVYNGYSRVVGLLQAKGAKPAKGQSLPQAGQRAKDLALTETSSGSNLAAIKAWLSRGADPNAVVYSSSDKEPPRVAQLSTPISSAAKSVTITRLLLRVGANPNAITDGGTTPLMNATVPVSALLLAWGAKVNVRANDGTTALMMAADDPSKVRLLLSHGADVRAQDAEGRTALMFCSKGNALERDPNSGSLQQLLARGADINHANNVGQTVLIEAAQQGYGEGGVTCDADWARVLLRHGADPNRRDHNGRTALMVLAEPFGQTEGDAEYYAPENRAAFARMLLARGARRDFRDRNGHTALQLARRSKAWQLARVLNSR